MNAAVPRVASHPSNRTETIRVPRDDEVFTRIPGPCASRGVVSRGFVVDRVLVVVVVRGVGGSPGVELSLPSRALPGSSTRPPRAGPGGRDTLRRPRRPGVGLDRAGGRLPRGVQGRRSGWVRRGDPLLPRRHAVGLRRVGVRRRPSSRGFGQGRRRRGVCSRKSRKSRGPGPVRLRRRALALRVGRPGAPCSRAARRSGGWFGRGARRRRAPRVQGSDAEVAHAPAVRPHRDGGHFSVVLRARRVRASEG